MSDAPEMLWVNLSTGYVSVRPSKYSAEYIRADIHKAEVARLREALEGVLYVCCPRHYPGDFCDCGLGAHKIAHRALNLEMTDE